MTRSATPWWAYLLILSFGAFFIFFSYVVFFQLCNHLVHRLFFLFHTPPFGLLKYLA